VKSSSWISELKPGCIQGAWLVVLTALCVGAAVPPAFELKQGRLEPVVARAGRPTRLVAEVRNAGRALPALELCLTLPAGVTHHASLTTMTNWKRGEIRHLEFELTASQAVQGHARLDFRQEAKLLDSLEIPVRWIAPVAVSPAQYVPVPQTVDTGSLLLGAVHCPLWGNGSSWRRIEPFPDREPALGWYDEGIPEVTDWEIKWALDHGISFFMVCWYRANDNGSKPVQPALGHWLQDGFFQSHYRKQFKFALIFENGNKHFCGETSEQDLLQNLLPFWLETYFKRPDYLVLDGKPVLTIYSVERLVRDLGGEQKARAVIAKVQSACEQAGFKGLYLLGQYCWGNTAELRKQAEQIRRLGMDASWSYHWPTFAGAFGGQLHPTGPEAIAAQEQIWRTQPQPNLLTLSMGWDSEPWGFPQTRTQWRLTPEEFKTLCQRAKAVLAERPGQGIANRLVLLDNWNEFGEGHYLMPTRQHGFGYLDAVREVFAPTAPAHTDFTPLDVGRGPYDARFRALQSGEGSKQ
jgi:hypothetical protein